MPASATKGNRVQSTSLVGPIVDAYYDDLRRAPKEGRLVCAFTGLPVFQIVRAMDVAIVHTDGWAAGAAARRADRDFFDTAEDEGFSRDSCSYLRMNLGCAAIADTGAVSNVAHPEWVMPRPDLAVTIHLGCELHGGWQQAVCQRLGIPGFFVDQPFVWRESEIDRAVAAVTRNLRELVVFLEKFTGRRYNWDRLKELVANTKKSALLRMEALALCRNKPAPATYFDWLISLAPINFLLGMPVSYEYFTKFKVELEDRVRQGVAAVPDEKYRLHWEGITVWNKVGWLAEKFASLGAAVVSGRYPHFGFYAEPERIDPERPLESLADFMVRFHLNRNLDWLIGATVRMCEEYSIDGILFQAVRTCRAVSHSQLEVRDGVSKKMSIPRMIFDSDHTDASYYSDAQLDSRLQGLLETIDANRVRR